LNIGCAAAIAAFVGNAVSISYRAETRTLHETVSNINTGEQIIDIICSFGAIS
jgi:hypothetical protein